MRRMSDFALGLRRQFGDVGQRPGARIVTFPGWAGGARRGVGRASFTGFVVRLKSGSGWYVLVLIGDRRCRLRAAADGDGDMAAAGHGEEAAQASWPALRRGRRRQLTPAQVQLGLASKSASGRRHRRRCRGRCRGRTGWRGACPRQGRRAARSSNRRPVPSSVRDSSAGCGTGGIIAETRGGLQGAGPRGPRRPGQVL